MEIKRFISTVLDENIYLLSKKQDCLLIDPGGDNISEVVSYIKENKFKSFGYTCNTWTFWPYFEY